MCVENTAVDATSAPELRRITSPMKSMIGVSRVRDESDRHATAVRPIVVVV